MKDTELLTMFEIHKQGAIYINHSPHERVFPTSITLEDLFRMFELVKEKRESAVRQD